MNMFFLSNYKKTLYIENIKMLAVKSIANTNFKFDMCNNFCLADVSMKRFEIAYIGGSISIVIIFSEFHELCLN